MITKNDIQSNGNNFLSYIDDNNICYQFETWDSLSSSKLEDAKSQFAMILNLIIDRPVQSIEKHMILNGFNGIADVYKIN